MRTQVQVCITPLERFASASDAHQYSIWPSGTRLIQYNYTVRTSYLYVKRECTCCMYTCLCLVFTSLAFTALHNDYN